MKIQMDFVTNSSSTAFCIIGVWMTDMEKLYEELYNIYEKDGEYNYEDYVDILEDSYNLKEITDIPFQHIYPSGYRSSIIGVRISDAVEYMEKNDLTMKQFKQKVIDVFNKLTDKPLSISDIEVLEAEH